MSWRKYHFLRGRKKALQIWGGKCNLWMLPGRHAFLQLSNFGLEAANRLLNSLGLAPRTRWEKSEKMEPAEKTIFPYFPILWQKLTHRVFNRILVWPRFKVSWLRRERVALPVLPISPAMVAFLSKAWSLGRCGLWPNSTLHESQLQYSIASNYAVCLFIHHRKPVSYLSTVSMYLSNKITNYLTRFTFSLPMQFFNVFHPVFFALTFLRYSTSVRESPSM